MKKKLETLIYHFRNKSNVDLCLSANGEVIYSNLCTLYPLDLTLIRDLDLVLDVYISRYQPRLRFFRNEAEDLSHEDTL